MKMCSRGIAAAVVFLFLGGALWAEEIELVDGSKIKGSIVGYEGDMFRVQTDFGFARVRKDRVTSISFPPPAPELVQVEVKEEPSGEKLAAEKKKEPAQEILAQAEMPDYFFETVCGNTYINHRYKFAMYKPPTWIMFNEIREASPTDVMAFRARRTSRRFFSWNRNLLRGTRCFTVG